MKKAIILTLIVFFAAAPTVFAVSPGRVNAVERAAAKLERAAEIKAQIEQLKDARAEEREQIRTQVLTRVQNKAAGEIDRIVARYQRIKTRVNKMSVISEARKAEITSTIDAKVAELEDYKPQIQAATTAQEVRDLMKKIKTEVRKNATIVKQIVASIHATHLDGIVTKLTEVVTKLEANGGDATLIATAQTQLTEATSIIKTGEFKSAKDKILEARKTLIEVAQALSENQVETDEEVN